MKISLHNDLLTIKGSRNIKEIVNEENKIQKRGLPKDYNEFNRIKSIGFSDKKLSEITKISEDIVRKKRTAFKQRIHRR